MLTSRSSSINSAGHRIATVLISGSFESMTAISRSSKLGSVYEGLLEFKPRYAWEDMILIRSRRAGKPDGNTHSGARDASTRL